MVDIHDEFYEDVQFLFSIDWRLLDPALVSKIKQLVYESFLIEALKEDSEPMNAEQACEWIQNLSKQAIDEMGQETLKNKDKMAQLIFGEESLDILIERSKARIKALGWAKTEEEIIQLATDDD